MPPVVHRVDGDVAADLVDRDQDVCFQVVAGPVLGSALVDETEIRVVGSVVCEGRAGHRVVIPAFIAFAATAHAVQLHEISETDVTHDMPSLAR